MEEELIEEGIIGEVRVAREARSAARGAGGNAVSNVGHSQNLSPANGSVVVSSPIRLTHSRVFDGVTRQTRNGDLMELKNNTCLVWSKSRVSIDKFYKSINFMSDELERINTKELPTLWDIGWKKFAEQNLHEVSILISEYQSYHSHHEYRFSELLSINDDVNSDKSELENYKSHNNAMEKALRKLQPVIDDIDNLNSALLDRRRIPHLSYLLNRKVLNK